MDTKNNQGARGAKAQGRYTHVENEIARLSGLDRSVVHQVLATLPVAILALFDRADRSITLPGLGQVEYRFRAGWSNAPIPENRVSRWHFVLRPLLSFHRQMRTLLGTPVAFREPYPEAVERRRQVIRRRYERLGGEPEFRD